MSELRIATVQAGLGNPSTTSRLADALQGALVAEAGSRGVQATVTRIDLRDIAVRVVEATISGVQSEELEEAIRAVFDADVLIAVTPTFNASYSGVFKSFFDLLDVHALEGKVTVLGATGGTSRHSLVVDLAMRPMFAYLRAMPVPTSVFASSSDFAGGDSIARRATVVAREVLALVAADGTRTSTAHSRSTEREKKKALEEAGFSRDGEDSPEVLESRAGGFVPFSEIAKNF